MQKNILKYARINKNMKKHRNMPKYAKMHKNTFWKSLGYLHRFKLLL